MSPSPTPRPHGGLALLSVAVGAAAAFASLTLGPVTLAVCLIVLVIGHGRTRGWRVARWLDRPRLFVALGALYLPLLLVDLLIAARSDPFPALGRLVVFLVAAEVLAGDGRRSHRPVLFGLMLLVSAAAGTTDIWFALPLGVFVLVALSARARSTAEGDGAAPDHLPPSPRPRGLVAVTAVTLALGLALFFVIPHAGAGWGRRPNNAAEEASLETGLGDAVNLGVVGRVKQRRTIVFRADVDPDRDLRPAWMYWRARSYSVWTGDGWSQSDAIEARQLNLPPDRAVPVSEGPETPADLVASIQMDRPRRSPLLVPGEPVWLRTPRPTIVFAAEDGSVLAHRGRTPRRYDVAVSRDEPRPGQLRAAAGEDEETLRQRYLPAPGLADTVVDWSESVGVDAATRFDLVRAFEDDLRARPYSLDTTGIDPLRPVASFLEGSPAHCEYFASAMVLGLRHRGVPARVVSGYLGADRVPVSRDLIVRESRAHLWVEVHFPGVGWATFDPTPEAGLQPAAVPFLTLRTVLDRLVMTWDSWVIGLDMNDQLDLLIAVRETAAAVLTFLRQAAPWIAGLAAAVVLVWWARRRGAWRRALAPDVPRFYRRLLRLAARRGFAPGASETAREFAARAGASLGDREAVVLISGLYERERFGGRPPSGDELSAARAALARLA